MFLDIIFDWRHVAKRVHLLTVYNAQMCTKMCCEKFSGGVRDVVMDCTKETQVNMAFTGKNRAPSGIINGTPDFQS